MKKQYFIIALLFIFSVTAKAQFTISRDHFHEPGETLTYILRDTAGVSPGPSGINQTWDFSGLEVLDGAESVNIAVETASSSDYASEFPDANIAASPDSSTAFEQINQSEYLMWGAVTEQAQSGVTVTSVMQYSDPQTVITFPFNYEDHVTDELEGTTTTSVQGTETVSYRTGTITTTYDAYGTIILPNGNQKEVARLKIEQYNKDSTSTSGVTTIQEGNVTTYYWLAGNADYYTFGINIYESKSATLMDGDTLSATESTITKEVVDYSSDETGIQQSLRTVSDLQIYPKPAHANINVKYEVSGKEDVQFILHNLAGETIRKSRQNNVTGGSSHKIKCGNIPAGLYLLEIQVGNNAMIKKVQIN